MSQRLDNQNVTENLQDIIDNSQAGIDALSQLTVATANANSFAWKGIWSSITAYKKNEITSYLNTSYICLLDNTNNLPNVVGSTFWGILAEKGSVLDPLVDNSVTIRKPDNSASVRMQIGTSGGLEFVIN